MRAWTLQELRVIKAYAPMGAVVIASVLERTPQAVRHVAALNGISVTDTGKDVDTQAVTLGLAERLRETPGLSVCPMCGKRFARMKSGLCRCCHLDRLLDLHQERLDEEIRLRKLNKARQDKRRMRVCDVCGRPFFPRSTSKETTCQDCA